MPLLQKRRLLADWEGSAESFIAMCLSATRRRFPYSKIHVFGAGGTRTFPAVVALGADSADSIGWRHAAGFGSVFLPLKSQRIIAPRGSERAIRKVLDRTDAADLMQCECPVCKRSATLRGRIGFLKKSFHDRSIHNAWVSANQPCVGLVQGLNFLRLLWKADLAPNGLWQSNSGWLRQPRALGRWHQRSILFG